MKVVALIGLALVAAGCGASEEEGVRRSFDEYRAAILAGDATRVCAVFTEAGRKAVGGTRGCTAVLDDALRGFSARSRADLRAARIAAVQVHGRSATAQLEAGDAPLRFRKERGGWRIEAR